MPPTSTIDSDWQSKRRSLGIAALEVLALLALFFVYAGDPAPAVNEAHYLVKAKNYWDPNFCSGDLFASSGKAHTTFYWTFGVLTQITSLNTTAWIGRVIGWLMLAIGLRRCCRNVGLPVFASIGVAVLWLVGIEYGNLAGEWVVGGIEAKVPAYALVLIGLSEVVRRKWSRAWVWLGAASAFHVLTGGWAVIAAMISFLVTERVAQNSDDPPVKFFSVGLFVGGALSLFGLVPALALTLGTTPQESTEAARIYSYFRIRHHLLPHDFSAHWFLRHGALAILLLWLTRSGTKSASQRRGNWFAMGALGIAIAGLLVGAMPAIMPDLAAKLLRYYWFRLSDAMVPLVVALGLMQFVPLRSGNLLRIGDLLRSDASKSAARKYFALASLVLATGMFTWSVYQRNQVGVPPSTSHRLLGIELQADGKRQRQRHADWVAVCDWIRLSMPEDEVLLTPRHQQTFKWYSHRAEVVNWKDVPQDAKSLLEWKRRFDDVFPKRLGTVPLNSTRVPIGYAKLKQYREKYGVRFMVVDHRIATDNLPLVKLYPSEGQTNRTYSVFELPYN